MDKLTCQDGEGGRKIRIPVQHCKHPKSKKLGSDFSQIIFFITGSWPSLLTFYMWHMVPLREGPLFLCIPFPPFPFSTLPSLLLLTFVLHSSLFSFLEEGCAGCQYVQSVLLLLLFFFLQYYAYNLNTQKFLQVYFPKAHLTTSLQMRWFLQISPQHCINEWNLVVSG